MVYCFDLDGTLCNTDGNNYKDSTPKKERIEIVNTLYEDGHTILIDTARGCVSGKNYFFFTMDQLKSWVDKFHSLRTGVKLVLISLFMTKGCEISSFLKINLLLSTSKR